MNNCDAVPTTGYFFGAKFLDGLHLPNICLVIVIVFPRLVYLINAAIIVHCSRNHVNNCHTVPTTGYFFWRNFLIGYTSQIFAWSL